MGRGVGPGQGTGQGEDVEARGERGGEATAEVHLVHVAGQHRLADGPHALGEALLVETGHPGVEGDRLPRPRPCPGGGDGPVEPTAHGGTVERQDDRPPTVTAGVQGSKVVGYVAQAGEQASAHNGRVHPMDPTREVMTPAYRPAVVGTVSTTTVSC
jgi:hypothetical protein